MFKQKRNFLTLVSICLLIASCNDMFVDGYSEDPNLPTDAPAEKVFIGVQAAQIVYHEGYASRLAAMWDQQFVGIESQYESRYEYGVTTQDFINIWPLPYVRILGNLSEVKQKARAEGKQNLLSVAKISEALTIGTTTALFGDVPYSEAANEGNLNPVFDDQVSVYNAVIDTLEQAITNIESGLPDLPDGVDAFSPQGDLQQWLLIAYTLKARFHLHLSNTDNSRLDQALQAAQNGIMQNDGSGDLMIPHGTVSGENVNLWSSFTSDRGYLTGDNSYSLSLMNNRNNSKTDETARMNYYFDPSDDFLPNIDDGAYQPSSPFPLVTYVENMLIIAEVEARLGNDQQALDALNVVRQFNEDTYGGTYQDLTLVDFQAGGDYEETTILQEVLDEAYLSYMSRIEAFNLVRRVDYPLPEVSPNATTIPQRFLYSESESNGNSNIPDPLPGLFDETPVNQ